MTSTAGPEGYHPPKHLVGVAGYITNEKGEVLLVRNLHRSYTAEIPGGLLEEGETLIEGVKREILEETGVEVKINGLSTVNQNLSSGNISVVFNGEYVSGELTPQEGETSEVFFEKLGEHNIDEFITATQLKDRTLDAMKEQFVPHQTYRSRPEYQRITRLEGRGS
ncbi:NUDIX hydrolase [Piscibacillus sp. B03]|uniref:NUDIX hydrolase n=1 Tax=Piscibacillus sp. B03 TaxID=3457430 RepID=UPI003FCD0E96